MADNSAVFNLIDTKLTLFETEALGYADDAITAAMGWATFPMNQTGFDAMPVWTNPDITAQTLADLPVSRPDYSAPTWAIDPATVTALMPANQTQLYQYFSDLFDNFLDTFLRGVIQDESYFADATLQDALFDKTREKDLQAFNDLNDQVARQVSSQRGFPTPNTILTNELAKVNVDYTNQQLARNDEITGLIAERLHDARKHGIDAAIKMEEIRSRAQMQFQGYYFALIDALVQKYKTDVGAELESVKNEITQIFQLDEVEKYNSQLAQQQFVKKMDALFEDRRVNQAQSATELQQRIEAAKAGASSAYNLYAGTAGMLSAVDLDDKTGT